ncbi:retrovirus-related pol polyprotein from transposon 17.6 [Tanacetum coccineum]
MPPKRATTPMTNVAIKELIAQRVADGLAEYEAYRSSGNGDDSHDSGSGRRRTEHTTRECMYSDFLKCQPLNFKGTEGVNSHVKTVGHDAAYGMPWKRPMKMMTDKYCPRSEIKGMEIEIWNLKVKGTDVVEKYVGVLPDMIQGSVMASKPKTMQEAIEFANELMDQKICTFAEKQAENKRKLDNNSSDNNRLSKGKMVGHLTRDCKSPTAANNQRTLTCYECGNQGHYRSDCPELKNQNHGNQAGGTEARGMVYALEGGETDQDPNNMEDDINA